MVLEIKTLEQLRKCGWVKPGTPDICTYLLCSDLLSCIQNNTETTHIMVIGRIE
jgi:hypothetical protein